jgi:hypothetical protein
LISLEFPSRPNDRTAHLANFAIYNKPKSNILVTASEPLPKNRPIHPTRAELLMSRLAIAGLSRRAIPPHAAAELLMSRLASAGLSHAAKPWLADTAKLKPKAGAP